MILDFLRRTRSRRLYLVGDVIAAWRLRRGWVWPLSHRDAVQELLQQVHSGTRVMYMPGNRDEFARDYVGLIFGSIEAVHDSV